MKTIEEVKNEVAAGLRMRDFHGNLIGDWETFHSIYGIHQNTLEILMKRWAQEENSRLLEEKAKLIEENKNLIQAISDIRQRT